MEENKKKRIRKMLKIILVALLIIVCIFAVVNLFTDNYIRDVLIKGVQPKKY